MCCHYARRKDRFTPQSLRELAYIMGGVGGPGQHPYFVHGGRWLRCQQTHWDLRWNKQMSCGRFDFTLPWVLAQWQPPLRRKLPMPDLAAPRDMTLAQTALYSLAERSTTDMYIPDGVLPRHCTGSSRRLERHHQLPRIVSFAYSVLSYKPWSMALKHSCCARQHCGRTLDRRCAGLAGLTGCCSHVSPVDGPAAISL